MLCRINGCGRYKTSNPNIWGYQARDSDDLCLLHYRKLTKSPSIINRRADKYEINRAHNDSNQRSNEKTRKYNEILLKLILN